MTNLEFMRVSRETQAHADDNPVLLALWRDYVAEHEPSLQGFDQHLAENIGQLIVERMSDGFY